MTARQIGFGVLGCGVIGEFHCRAIKAAPAARLVAVADTNPKRAQALAEKHGCSACSSLEEMLQWPDVEAVSICTPSGLHADQGMEAARQGRHVLLEKPMDRNLTKVSSLIAYCRRKGLKLGCIFQYRCTESARRLKEAIDAGRLGRIISASAEVMWYRSPEYYKSGSWRGTLALDGGCLWNQGVHSIDLLCWMLGKPKKVLSAYVATMERKIEAEDFGAAHVLFRNGAVGLIRVTTAAYPGLPARLEICGTKGTAVLTDEKLEWFGLEVEPGEDAAEKPAGAGAAGNAQALEEAGHIALVQDFSEAVLFDRVPLVDGDEGRQAVKLLTEIYRVAGVRLLAR